MKVIKSLLLFSVCLVLVSSCFDPPQFPDRPSIDFRDIYFREVGTNTQADSLVVTISFRDGDGDLGLSSEDTAFPFQEINFFADANGKLINISELTVGQLTPDMKLTTVRSRNKPELASLNLPGFTFPFNCTNFTIETMLIPEARKFLIDATYNITDTLTQGGTTLYQVIDTFYTQKNSNYYNLEVEFWIRDPANPNAGQDGFYRLNWETLYPYPTCGENFNGRFPLISRDGKVTPREGNIKYAMRSNGFRPLLGNRTFRLVLSIRDRKQNQSNILTTAEYTLDKIKR